MLGRSARILKPRGATGSFAASSVAMNHWLVKQEPSDFSWDCFVSQRGTPWTGVRNYQARNFLRAMKSGDCVLFYHSGDEKSVVGLARVERAPYPDPTATEGDWVCVDLAPVRALRRPVPLAEIKARPELRELMLVTHARLSVSPVSPAHYALLLEMGT